MVDFNNFVQLLSFIVLILNLLIVGGCFIVFLVVAAFLVRISVAIMSVVEKQDRHDEMLSHAVEFIARFNRNNLVDPEEIQSTE